MNKHLVCLVLFTMLIAVVPPNFFLVSNVRAVSFNDGDIHSYVNGSFSFAEDIIVEGNTTLIIENATITFSQTKNNQYGIKLSSSPSGNPHLRISNANLTSTKSFQVILSGNSTAEFEKVTFRGSISSTVSIQDFSSLDVYQSKVYYVKCYNFSRLNSVGSTFSYVYVYDNSFVDFMTSSISKLWAYGDSNVNATVTSVTSGIFAEGSSVISFGYSSLMGDISSGDNSSITFVGVSISNFRATTYKHGTITFINATSTPSKYSGQFVLNDFSTVNFSLCKLTDFIFTILGSSSLNIKNSIIASSVFYAKNASEVKVESSYVDWLFEVLGNSKIYSLNSSFNILSFEDFSIGTINASKIAWARCYKMSKIFVSNSEIVDILVELTSLNLSLSSFQSGFFENFVFETLNFSIRFIETYVKGGWSFRFLGSSRIDLYNSKLVNVDLFDSVKLYLVNCSYYNLNVHNFAEVWQWSYLKVHVLDYFGSPVKDANVTVNLDDFSNSTLTDLNGDAVFKLFDKKVNATGEYSVGKYRLNIVFGNISQSHDLELNGSQTFTYSVASPWWYWYAIYSILIVAVTVIGIVAFLFLKRKRRVKS